MPLDVDQYNVRRIYWSGRAYLVEPTTTRNENGVVIGTTYEQKQRLAYKMATLTQIDRVWLGEVVNRVSKKIEIPYDKSIKEREKTLTIQIEDQYYNIAQMDINLGRNMFLYLERATKKGTKNNG